MEKIRDLLLHEHPRYNSVSTHTTVRDALYKMYCEHIDFLVVVEDEKFVGILTEHEVAGKVLFSEKPLQNTEVKEFMNTQVPVAMYDDKLEDAIFLMEHYGARYLAVYDDFEFQTVLSSEQLMRKVLKNKQAAVS